MASNMESNMEGKKAAMALRRKHLELRVAYMEHLHAHGKEDALTEVALSLHDLSEWIADEQRGDDDRGCSGSRSSTDCVAIGLLVARHLQLMPLRRDDARDARALSTQLLRLFATHDDAVLVAAQTAVALFDYDLHALVSTLIVQGGMRLEEDETQLWRMLIIVRNVLRFAPASLNYDQILYDPLTTDALENCDHVRLADLINGGLGSAITGCRIEAVRVLRSLALYLQLETGLRVVEILLDAATEEANDDAGQFVLANVWEICFARPQLAQAMLSEQSESRSTPLWETLRASSPKLRRASVHGALRAILHAKTPDGFELELLSQIIEIYASGAEHDTKCQKLMFDFFEDNLGKSQIHQNLVANAIVKGTSDAYLAGLPLPSVRNAELSQTRQVSEEALLHRRNKLLMATLNERTAKEVIATIKLMLRDEFSSVYSAQRIAEFLGAPSRPRT